MTTRRGDNVGREQNYNVKARSTVRTVSGSKRHLSKTHGSHNQRTGSWPHRTDDLDRPRRLPTPSDERGEVWQRNRKHKRISNPQLRVAKYMYQDGARDLPRLPRWKVTGHRVYDHGIVDVTLCAQSESEAIGNGEQILRFCHMCIIVNIEAARVNT